MLLPALMERRGAESLWDLGQVTFLSKPLAPHLHIGPQPCPGRKGGQVRQWADSSLQTHVPGRPVDIKVSWITSMGQAGWGS